jgi:hypothetical protein
MKDHQCQWQEEKKAIIEINSKKFWREWWTQRTKEDKDNQWKEMEIQWKVKENQWKDMEIQWKDKKNLWKEIQWMDKENLWKENQWKVNHKKEVNPTLSKLIQALLKAKNN